MATPPKKPGTTARKPARSGPANRRGRGATPRRNASGQFTAKSRGHVGTALIVGVVAAVGALATGALLALRGSTASHPDDAFDPAEHADRYSPAEFPAGLADENTIPDPL